jgi:serine/threonine protein phosphatase PrpC
MGTEMAETARQSFSFAAETATGIRDHNEDRWGAHPDAGLFFVSDGVGGAPNGEVAAQTAVDLLMDRLAAVQRDDTVPADPETTLGTAIAQLSDELNQRGQREAEVAGTGATIVAALVTGDRCTIASLGDSPAYLMHDGQLVRLTTDHTIAQVLVDAGAISDEAGENHPGRNKLTRYFGMKGPAHPDVTTVAVAPRDRLLMCSDGVSGVLEAETLLAMMTAVGDPNTLCRALVRAATNAKSKDNMTALVVDFH